MKIFLLCAIVSVLSMDCLTAATKVQKGGCCPSKGAMIMSVPRQKRGKQVTPSDFDSREERKIYLEKKLLREKPGTKKYVEYKQERERLALDEVHESQRFFQNRLNKKNKKISKTEREREFLLKSEVNYLRPVLEKIEDFPFAEQLLEIYPVVKDIKSGRIEFENCQGRSESRILKKIQEVQRGILKDYHKDFLKKNF
jgi:hypothetical protein